VQVDTNLGASSPTNANNSVAAAIAAGPAGPPTVTQPLSPHAIDAAAVLRRIPLLGHFPTDDSVSLIFV
jgi:hypothetical protein